MQRSWPSLLAVLAILGLAFYWAPQAKARRLAFAPEFGVASAEFRELSGFLQTLQRRRSQGDVAGVRMRLEDVYAKNVEERLQAAGRRFDAAGLRAFEQLVPLPQDAEAQLIWGGSAGSSVLLLFAEELPGSLRRRARRQLWTALPLRWDGHGFRLGMPVFRQVLAADRALDPGSLAAALLRG